MNILPNASLICSGDCTFTIDSSANVWSFGSSNYGQSGHSTAENDIISPCKEISSLTNIKMISCGEYHCICLNYDGEVFSFGKNSYKQLGIDKSVLPYTHIPQKLKLPTIKYVSCGCDFTVCLTDDGELYSFGHTIGVINENEGISKIKSLQNIELMECGGYHIICKTYDNTFYSWGTNYSGQLGLNDYTTYVEPQECTNWPDNIISIRCGLYHSLLLSSEGYMYSFGSNTNGQLGIGDKDIENKSFPTKILNCPEIKRIECGLYFNLTIDVNNDLYVFGSSHFRQLGLSGGDKHTPTKHTFFNDVIDISSGGRCTFIKTSENKIYGFGDNTYAKLGKKTKTLKQDKPIQVLEGKEDIWNTNYGKSRQKSARK